MIKPRKLNSGDKVAAVSLSWGGPGVLPNRYQIGKKQLCDEFGLEVVETRHARRDPAWLAKNPRARADDLMEAFADPSIRAIISTIGGDDSIRLLPYLNEDVIRANPKVFLGPVWPDASTFEGAILFLETSEQAPPPALVAQELRVYAGMGILRRLSGILFGRPGGAIPIEAFRPYDEAILRVVAGEEHRPDLPVASHMDFGHTDPMFVLPYGVRAQIDCDKNQVAILEGAVTI